ncbi:polysaccharide biosynthesis tyrosine autokinase [Shewanella sp. 10N.286.54.B9]|uniref:polysaccharide biosynthesis tyrosine autokinase n=1 Tax=Shewanella sp. 10N.286.54.B9 TaxID=3229719 RepID=UPI0035505213
MSSNTNNQAKANTANSFAEDIDFRKLLGTLIDAKWLILSITLVFTALGIINALSATPIYKADALIQIEMKSSGMSSLVGNMGDMFSEQTSASTEIEIIKSRTNLGKTVDQLNLTTYAAPKYMPYVGKRLARLLKSTNHIAVSRFETPAHAGFSYILTIDDVSSGAFTLFDNNERKVLSGVVNELAKSNGYKIFVESINGAAGDQFVVGKRAKSSVIQSLQGKLVILERGKRTGILQLTFSGEDKALNEKILNSVTQNYFLQSVAHNSAEAEKSLDFLKKHLPNIKSELTANENTLNSFRQQNDSIDLGLEAQSTLKVMVGLEAQLNELTFKESEISQRFTKGHPAYKSLLDKRSVLLSEKERLNKRIQGLPETQREVLRMTRDVEVNQQIYIQLLNKVQELSILKAGTVGNVRILDVAQSYTGAVSPKKLMIVTIAMLLGGVLSIALVLVRAALHKGVESPDEIEALGIPVYASIPLSDWQAKLDVKLKQNKHKIKLKLSESLLAESNPADLSIEALRALRTSMHFAMMEAKNNVVMISGPAPSIGKSFVSANLATVIAKGEQRVLLVDGDMRKGYLQRHFNLQWDDGLSDLLSGRLKVQSVIKASGITNLDIISRGQVPPNPSELLLHPRFTEFVEWASSEYDIVIIDTPPVLAVTDPSIVGAVVGTTLMVGRFGKNTVKEIDVARHRFDMAGIEVKGFILNAVEKKASASYGYGYYNYSYESDKT